MIRRPPRSTRTDTLFPYTTLFRSRLATSILAVLRSGGAYLPLSPELPSERVRFILADSGARHVVSMPELVPELPADAALDIIPADDADGSRAPDGDDASGRSEEHTSELQSLMRISYAVFCLKKKT